MAACVTAAKINSYCSLMCTNPPKISVKLRGGNKDEVRFGLWKKFSPGPLTPLVTKISPNENKSHVGSLRATLEQQQMFDCLNDLACRQTTFPAIEILLEDNNGAIWNELKDICEGFGSSNKSKSTSKLMLEMMQFLLRHDKCSIHHNVKFVHDFPPKKDKEVNEWLHWCYVAEYRVELFRMFTKLFRLFKWGRNSSTVFIRLTTHINNDDVSMDEFRNCLAEHEDGDVDVDDLFSKICKGDNIAMHLSSTICFQPRVLLFASAKQDFGESPPVFVFDSAFGVDEIVSSMPTALDN